MKDENLHSVISFLKGQPSRREEMLAIEPVPGEVIFFEVHWLLTRRCSYSCSYCPPHRHNNRAPQVNELTIIRGLSRLVQLLKGRSIRINLTGGEPTIHPDFLGFIRQTTFPSSIKAVRVVTNLSSSERLFTGLGEIAAAKPGHVQVVASFHWERANPQSFTKRVYLLLNSGIQVLVKLMVDASNLDLLRRLASELSILFKSYPHFAIAIQRVRNLGVNPDSELENVGRTYFQNISQWNDRRIMILRSEEEIKYQILEDVDSLIRRRENSFTGWICDAGVNALFIDSDGSVFSAGCKPEPAPLFNLFDEHSVPPELRQVRCPHAFCECASMIRIPKRHISATTISKPSAHYATS